MYFKTQLLLLGFSVVACASHAQYKHISVEKIQQQNIETLTAALPLGWKSFCESPVDENVMWLYSGTNPSDATLHLVTLNNQSVELPIKSLSEIRDFDINPKRRTLIYVNAVHTPDSYFSVQSHLQLLQATRRDLNIILVDFAKDILQLFFAVRHHVDVLGHFVSRVLAVLLQNGVAAQDITLVGHSVGANIAALGARLLSVEMDVQLGQLIAIDPALMCRPSDVHATFAAAANGSVSRVVVIHGEGDVFGIRGNPLGSSSSSSYPSCPSSIEIYPNGIGHEHAARSKLQPGCESPLCSHMYPFVLFMESLIEGVMIPAVKCDSWSDFRNRSCDYQNTVAIGLRYPDRATGAYFCVTQANPPFTFMEHGLRYRRTSATKILVH